MESGRADGPSTRPPAEIWGFRAVGLWGVGCRDLSLSSCRPIRRRRAWSDPGQFLQQVAVQSLPGLKIGDREILIRGVGLAVGQGEAEQ